MSFPKNLRSRSAALTTLLAAVVVTSCSAISDRNRLLVNDGHWQTDEDLFIQKDPQTRIIVLPKESELVFSPYDQGQTELLAANNHFATLHACEKEQLPTMEKCELPLPANACAAFRTPRFHLLGAVEREGRARCFAIWLQDEAGNDCEGKDECVLRLDLFAKDQAFATGGGAGGSAKGLPRPQRVTPPIEPINR